MYSWTASREVNFITPTKSPQEKLREYNRRYREKNNKDITCKCGAVIKKISEYTHLKSKKHKTYNQEL